MNKQKAIKTIDNLIEEITSRANTEEYAEAKLYINTWVIGGLKSLKSKLNGGFGYYPENATYNQLLQIFIRYYFCININPDIEMCAKACLYSSTIRSLIISLFENMVDIYTRNEEAHYAGYIDFDLLTNDSTKMAIIRHIYCRSGRC